MINNYYYYIFLLLVSLLSIIILVNHTSILAIESEYLRGVAQDTDLNLRNLTDGKELIDNELDFINLQSASYLVNENFLNVTFWTKSLDKLTSTNSLYGNVTYGVLINSDPSSNTGKDGVDYQFEIKLDKNKEKVIKELREISNEGYTKRIKAYKDDYTKILEKGNNYITMDLELKEILTPKVFKALFYAIYESPNNKNNYSSRFIDYLRWVNIPPPEVTITTKPESINLIQGKDEVLTIFANSKSVSDVFIHFYFQNQPKNLDINFSDNYVALPSMGEEFVEANIKANQNTDPRKVTLKLVSEFQFPNENIGYFNNVINNQTIQSEKESKYLVKNKVEKMATLIPLEVVKYDIFDEIYKIWEKLGGFLTFIYIPLAASLPWIIKKIRDFKHKR
jgi:hypothetical protein